MLSARQREELWGSAHEACFVSHSSIQYRFKSEWLEVEDVGGRKKGAALHRR